MYMDQTPCNLTRRVPWVKQLGAFFKDETPLGLHCLHKQICRSKKKEKRQTVTAIINWLLPKHVELFKTTGKNEKLIHCLRSGAFTKHRNQGHKKGSYYKRSGFSPPSVVLGAQCTPLLHTNCHPLCAWMLWVYIDNHHSWSRICDQQNEVLQNAIRQSFKLTDGDATICVNLKNKRLLQHCFFLDKFTLLQNEGWPAPLRARKNYEKISSQLFPL